MVTRDSNNIKRVNREVNKKSRQPPRQIPNWLERIVYNNGVTGKENTKRLIIEEGRNKHQAVLSFQKDCDNPMRTKKDGQSYQVY
jgi:hypothetical protein